MAIFLQHPSARVVFNPVVLLPHETPESYQASIALSKAYCFAERIIVERECGVRFNPDGSLQPLRHARRA